MSARGLQELLFCPTPSEDKPYIYVYGIFVTLLGLGAPGFPLNLQVLTLFNDRPFFIEPSIVHLTRCLEVPSKIGGLFW